MENALYIDVLHALQDTELTISFVEYWMVGIRVCLYFSLRGCAVLYFRCLHKWCETLLILFGRCFGSLLGTVGGIYVFVVLNLAVAIVFHGAARTILFETILGLLMVNILWECFLVYHGG